MTSGEQYCDIDKDIRYNMIGIEKREIEKKRKRERERRERERDRERETERDRERQRERQKERERERERENMKDSHRLKLSEKYTDINKDKKI